MKLSEYPEPIREAWATWETFRKLGFSADDIYWEFRQTITSLGPPGVPLIPGMALNVVLRAQGKVMVVTCSTFMSKEEAESLKAVAQTFHEEITSFTEEEMMTVYHASFIWEGKVSFIAVLGQKGFIIPKAMN